MGGRARKQGSREEGKVTVLLVLPVLLTWPVSTTSPNPNHTQAPPTLSSFQPNQAKTKSKPKPCSEETPLIPPTPPASLQPSQAITKIQKPNSSFLDMTLASSFRTWHFSIYSIPVYRLIVRPTLCRNQAKATRYSCYLLLHVKTLTEHIIPIKTEELPNQTVSPNNHIRTQ